MPTEDWDAITESVRTVREVSGDFDMIVTLSWDEAADVDRYDGEWNAGLYAQNRATCVTSVLPGYSKNPAKAVRLVSGSNWSTRGREVGFTNFDIRPTADRVLLRLRRAREVLYTGTSADGKEWREWKVGTDEELLSPDETVNVGVFIRPNSQRKTVATFSEFKLTTGKK